MRATKVALSVSLAMAVSLVMPAIAMAATANGISYAGSATCLECHGRETGRWQVGSYSNTLHGLNVRTIEEVGGVNSIFPAPNSAAWPSPIMAGGTFRFAPADVAYQLGGHDSHTTRFISKFQNDGPHVLSTGYTLPTTAGPKDDLIMFNGRYLSHEGYWNPGAIGSRLVMQNCGPCHFTGVTRPGQASYTLPNGSKMDASTPSKFNQHGITCESCHASNSGVAHWSTSVPVARTTTVLKSQTCGQCHVKFTSKQKNATGGAWTSPNGFTADQKLADFGTVAGSQWVKQSPNDPEPSIPATDSNFFPTGHLKVGGHGDGLYNEWLLSGHSHSLRMQNGQLYIPTLKDECLPCHSGEAFLQSIGYGASGPNDLSLYRSSVASDTLNIECGVCHSVHAQGSDGLKLRLEADELCMKCHVGGQAQLRTATGLVGVPAGEPWMPGAECFECHMPRTAEGDRSHRFTIMMPGDAEEWEDQFVEPEDVDSCSPCHHGETLGELQHDIDTWQHDIRGRVNGATTALQSAKRRRAATSAVGRALISAANTNISLIEGDSSWGVHNYPYAKAGLTKATLFANAVGARFSGFRATSYQRGAATVHGTLRFDRGSAKGQVLSIEAKPAGARNWVRVGTVTTGDGGSFAYVVRPARTTSYRVSWTPLSRVTIRSGASVVRR